MILFSVGTGMISTFDIDSPTRVWFGYQVLAGLGIGSGFQTGSLVIQTILPYQWISVGTACVQLMQSLGGAIFIAVAQTLFANGFIDQVTKDNVGINPYVFLNGGASQVREILKEMHREDATDAILHAYMNGLRNSYYLSTAMAVGAFCATLILEIRSVKRKAAAPPVKKEEPVSNQV